MMKKVMGNKISLPGVRLSFPELFEPSAYEDGQEPKYSATFLLDPKNPRHQRALKVMLIEQERMIAEAWEVRPPKLVLEYTGLGNDRLSQQTGEPYQGYEGMIYIASKNTKQPLVIDTEQVEIGSNDKRVYGGAYVNATINLFCQDNRFGRGIRASVRAVMVLGYGEPFGGGNIKADKEFADFDRDDDLGLPAHAGEFEDDGL